MSERTDDEIDAIARGALGESDEPARGADDDGVPIDPGRLLDYRAGRLDEAQAAEVEARLVDDPEARAILRELAEPVPPFIGAWARRQVGVTRRRRRWAVAAAGLALAAGIIIFALSSGRPSAPDYTIGQIRGLHAEVRGDDAPAGQVIDPEGVLTVVLEPTGPRETAPPSAAFVVDAQGRARRVNDGLTLGQGGAIRFRAGARALFGDGFGPRSVWIVVGLDDDAAAAAEGEPIEGARDRNDHARWLEVRVDYREVIR